MSWELEIVRQFQSVPALALSIMALFSFIGSPAFYLAFVAILAWWRERRFAFEIGALIVVGVVVNDLAKLLVHAPRPYWVTAGIIPYDAQASFGFPSAHAELAAAIWGLVALRVGRPLVTVGCALLVLLIGLSRLVLGVHYPIDVIGGYLIGLALLAGFVLAWPKAVQTARRHPLRRVALAALLLSLVAVAASALVAASIGPWSPDTAWTGPIAGLDPVSIEYTLIAAGFGLGLVLGTGADRGCRVFRSLPAGLVATLVGLIVLALLWFGAALLLPDQGVVAALGVYLRSAAVGAWCIAGAPQLFCRLGLYAGSDDA
ncbi:MAG: phosphatase PAP2 family protein [Methanoregulaceae archaeon]